MALLAIALLWLVMLTAFPALIAADLLRQKHQHGELCCLLQKHHGAHCGKADPLHGLDCSPTLLLQVPP